MDYYSSQGDYAGLQELMRSGASTVVDLIQASLASAPSERKEAMIAIMDNLEKEIQRSKTS